MGDQPELVNWPPATYARWELFPNTCSNQWSGLERWMKAASYNVAPGEPEIKAEDLEKPRRPLKERRWKKE